MAGIIEGYVNVKKLEVRKTGKSNVEIKPLYAKLGPVFKESAGAVAKALKEADANALMESIAKSGEYTLHTDKGPVAITAEYFETVQKLEKADAAAFKYGAAYVDKEISRELYEEAMIREFERGVQLARKDLGLKKADKIKLGYKTSPEMAELLAKYSKKLEADLNADSITRSDSMDAVQVKEFDIEEEHISVNIEKS